MGRKHTHTHNLERSDISKYHSSTYIPPPYSRLSICCISPLRCCSAFYLRSGCGDQGKHTSTDYSAEVASTEAPCVARLSSKTKPGEVMKLCCLQLSLKSSIMSIDGRDDRQNLLCASSMAVIRRSITSLRQDRS